MAELGSRLSTFLGYGGGQAGGFEGLSSHRSQASTTASYLIPSCAGASRAPTQCGLSRSPSSLACIGGYAITYGYSCSSQTTRGGYIGSQLRYRPTSWNTGILNGWNYKQEGKNTPFEMFEGFPKDGDSRKTEDERNRIRSISTIRVPLYGQGDAGANNLVDQRVPAEGIRIRSLLPRSVHVHKTGRSNHTSVL